jgi:hypothetical protein
MSDKTTHPMVSGSGALEFQKPQDHTSSMAVGGINIRIHMLIYSDYVPAKLFTV